MDANAEQARVEQFIDKGNYHAAINIAISALNAARRDNEQHNVDRFLDVISGIAETMRDQFGS